MHIDRPALEAAINASGGVPQPDDQIAALLAKLDLLEAKGRYGGLLRSVRTSNNKSNFLASLLEVTFAHQFETAGVPFDYEVRQEPGQQGTIDFRMTASTGDAVFFELRLVRQDERTTANIVQQLAAKQGYAVAIDVPPRRINEIVKGLRGITVDTALRLGAFCGTDAQSWVNCKRTTTPRLLVRLWRALLLASSALSPRRRERPVHD